MDRKVKREMEERGEEAAEEKEKQGPETTSCAAEEADDITLAQLSLSKIPKLKPKHKPKPKPMPLPKSNLNPDSNSIVPISSSSPKPIEKKSKNKKENAVSKINNSDVLSVNQVEMTARICKHAFDGRGGALSSALIRGEEVQSNLQHEYPSFVKSLVRSHVASCFWMGLPGKFCKAHLPDKDTAITLEDEGGKQYVLKYIAYKTGLSAGWRQFSAAHNLIEGDVLVFQLVEPTKFKVYIIRPNDFTEVDGALGLLNLDAQTKQNVADKDNVEMGTIASSNTVKKRPTILPNYVVKRKKKRSGLQRSIPYLRQLAEQSENDSEEVGSEVLEGSKLSEPPVQFKDIKSFVRFHILVDGMPIDSELSEDIRRKYFKLCHSQNAFLHDSLVKGINYNLIVGIILETVNIADAIKASKLTTTREEFSSWDQTLKAFEQLGMNVRFLRSRLRRIISLAYESESAKSTRTYLEARNEQSRTEDEIRNIEGKLAELKEACDGFGAYIESLKSKSVLYEHKFQQEVTAPW
ncbi:B3 domain-containing protein Os01g0234100 isoform X2 [Quercus suber]|uniref:B3 domain-containing protein Os01g0234100 isoform X2 n=1 Tax=Quercus suber TaxID=58331 RepID=UPI000CE1D729|nr:B3 domain-containing protein Os01g0234100-like isoform X2 [Quercus suber]